MRNYIIYFLLLNIGLLNMPLKAEISYLSPAEEEVIQKSLQDAASEPGAAIFTPPKGWRVADPKALSKSVRVMIVGKGAHEYPPSINLGTENYSGTLKKYLKRIKEINESKGAQWKDLGIMRTQAGEASLSQVDMKTQWGDVRMMHAILSKEGVIYILTAASLKDEFPKFYKEFFASLKSLRFNEKLK